MALGLRAPIELSVRVVADRFTRVSGGLLIGFTGLYCTLLSALYSDQECVLTGQGLPDLGFVLYSAIVSAPQYGRRSVEILKCERTI